MHIAPRLALLSCVASLLGCATTRILDQPFKAGDNSIALIIYTANTPTLIETGRTGYNEPRYTSFYDWFYGAFSWHYRSAGVYLFDPNIVNAFATRHDARPVAGYSQSTYGGAMKHVDKQYHFSFSATDLPGVLEAADELGATHIIKATLIKYAKQEYRSVKESKDALGTSWSRNESDNLRVDAEVDVTVFNVQRKEMLFQKNFAASDDRFELFGKLVGDANVRQSLATAIVKAIIAEEASVVAGAQESKPEFADANITSKQGIEIPEWTADGHPTHSQVFYPVINRVTRKGPNLLVIGMLVHNPTDYPVTLRCNESRTDRMYMRLLSPDGTQYTLSGSSALRDGLEIKPGQRADLQFVFACSDHASASFRMEGDWTYSVPHYSSEIHLRWDALPNP